MLDIKLIKKDKEKIEVALKKRMLECSLDNIIKLDDDRIRLQSK